MESGNLDGRPGGDSQLGDEDSRSSADTAAAGNGSQASGDDRPSPHTSDPDATAAGEGLKQAVEARHQLRFSALRNAFYHSARLRHFEFWHRALMFLIVLTGTAGAASVFKSGFGDQSTGDQWLALTTALLATVDLVLDLRGKAQLHDALKRRYYMLLAKLDESPDATIDQLRRWNGRVMRITAEEPVTYRITDAVAFNEAIGTLGIDQTERLYVSPWQHAVRHMAVGQGLHFVKVGLAPPSASKRLMEWAKRTWTKRRIER